MDVDGWEAEHRAAYDRGAWERACDQAGLLVAWYTERDLGLGAPAPRRFHADPGPRPKWPWGSRRHTLGLVLWRTAHDAGFLVDDVLLVDALRHCGPRADTLTAGPLPDAARTAAVGVAGAESVAGIGPVLRAHLGADPRQPRPGGVRLTVGYRVRELRATPDWEGGDWPAALALVREAMRRADDLRDEGRWHPTARERSAGARIGLDRGPAGGPTASGGRTPSWTARASHLVGLAAALAAAADTLPDDGRGRPGPLARVLGATADACAGLRTSAEEVRRLWTDEPDEPADPAGWELSRVPGALRVQTEETEDLVRAVSVFLWILACG